MRKNEQQLADELDAFLTAKLQGKEPQASQELPRSLTESATELIELAQSTTPDPTFLAELEEKLARAAARAPSSRMATERGHRPERLTFWQQLELFIRSLTMKRTILTIGAVAAVFVFAFFVWTALQDGDQEPETPLVADVTAPRTGETPAGDQDVTETEEATPGAPGQVADSGATPEETEPTELALLPRMNVDQLAGPAAAGRGGGGGEAAAEAAPLEPATAELGMVLAPDFTRVFSEATYVLNATLPLEPTAADVQQRSYHEMPLEEARQIADRFGFTGPLYTEVFNFGPRPILAEETLPEATEEEGGISVARPQVVEETPYVPPTVYHAFDGRRILSIMTDGIVYVDRSIQVRYGEDVANAVQIAEAFLQERGLLTFPYVVEQGYGGGDVLVRRVLDGITLEEPEIYVYVSSDGQIVSAHDRFSTSGIENLGSYPLISAESAWQLVLEGVVANNVSFNIMPNFEAMAEQELVRVEEIHRFWERKYLPGTEAHIYSGAMVYRQADGDGPPRIELGGLMNLNASDADLEAVAETQGEMIHVWGTIEDDGVTLTLTGWELMPNLPYTYLEGNIQRSGEQVLIQSSEGETFIIPDAPADLPDGLKVNLFAWTSRDAGLEYPVLDWQNIDEWFDYSSEPFVEPMPEPGIGGAFMDPYQFTEITINEVKLAYLQVFDFENFEKQSRPDEYLQPAWEFSGVTDNGDSIFLRVQAVAPEYLQAP